MGAVFLAHDTILHRQVALKVVDQRDTDDTSRLRLLQEARSAAALNHPHICTIHEVGEASGAPFIVMEYVEGCGLDDRIAEGRLTLDNALRYALDASDALAYAHDHGVVHRDFKAANIRITNTGRVKIVDFGLARRTDTLLAAATTMPTLVPDGTAAGTPYAMAPEQIRGSAADARTDIWAFGVLLHEMVGGSRPFAGATAGELFSSILRDRPAQLPAPVPAAVATVIDRCLEKDPDRRYQRVAEIHAALDAIASGTAPAWTGWRYRVVRHRWRLAATAALLAIGAGLIGLNLPGVRSRIVGPQRPPAIRLAVLPFENLTGHPDQEFFSDGLTDEMITELGRLHPQRLSVIARTSSARYKKRSVAIDQIGRELGVDYILEGSVLREGDRVRVNATLIDAHQQTQRWTETFDRDLNGLLQVQNEVASGVARSLALALLPSEQSQLAKARAVDGRAYELYLRGMFFAYRLTPADLDTAQHDFERALAADPNLALGYAGLAAVWGSRAQMGFISSGEGGPKSRAAALKAVELDPDLADAHYALANVRAWTDWDWTGGEAEYRKAIELNPNYANARALDSHLLNVVGRTDEAMSQIRRAVDLDPLNPLVQALYSVDLRFARRYDDAVAAAQSALKMAPIQFAYLSLVSSFHFTGRRDQAIGALKAHLAGLGDQSVSPSLDRLYAEHGYEETMRLAAERLSTSRLAQITPILIGWLYALGRDRPHALDWLEKALELRDPSLPYIGLEDFDPVRADPRYHAIRRSMHLPG